MNIIQLFEAAPKLVNKINRQLKKYGYKVTLGPRPGTSSLKTYYNNGEGQIFLEPIAKLDKENFKYIAIKFDQYLNCDYSGELLNGKKLWFKSDVDKYAKENNEHQFIGNVPMMIRIVQDIYGGASTSDYEALPVNTEANPD